MNANSERMLKILLMSPANKSCRSLKHFLIFEEKLLNFAIILFFVYNATAHPFVDAVEIQKIQAGNIPIRMVNVTAKMHRFN